MDHPTKENVAGSACGALRISEPNSPPSDDPSSSSDDSLSDEWSDEENSTVATARTRAMDFDHQTSLYIPIGLRIQLFMFFVWDLIEADIKNFIGWNGESFPDEIGWFLLLACLYDLLHKNLVNFKLPVICQKCRKRRAVVTEFCKRHQVVCQGCLAEGNSDLPVCPACTQLYRSIEEKSVVHAAYNGTRAIRWELVTDVGMKKVYRMLPLFRFIVQSRGQQEAILGSFLRAIDKKYLIKLMRLNNIYSTYFDSLREGACSRNLLLKALQFELAIRRPVLCKKCSVGNRVVTNECLHPDYCHSCLKKNQMICLESECETNVEEHGYTLLENVILIN